MIKLAYCNVENLDLGKAYRLLPQFRKDKIDRFRFMKDKKLSCGVYLLLEKLLSEAGITEPVFKLSKYEKAYISNYDDIYFNMSHSGKLVACAISDREVGVDVELNDHAIDLDIAKNYFFNEEYDCIMNSSNSSDEFFSYWVLKESYMKYTGLGFNLSLDSFQIFIDDEISLKNDKDNLKFNLFDVEEYKLGICSHYDVKKPIEYKIIDGFRLNSDYEE